MKKAVENKVKKLVTNKVKPPVETKVKPPVENKAAPPPNPQDLGEGRKEKDEKVLVELLPGRGIGGIGGPGTQVWMDPATAEQYAADGYVRILQEQPVIVVGSNLDQKKEQ